MCHVCLKICSKKYISRVRNNLRRLLAKQSTVVNRCFIMFEHYQTKTLMPGAQEASDAEL
jgi:hypothetical protein